MERLGLGGIALQLARNCVVESWDGALLRLTLDPSHGHLLGSRAEDRRDERIRVHDPPVGHGGHPSRRSHVQVGLVHPYGARSQGDHGEVTAAAEHGRARGQPEFTGCRGKESTGDLGGIDHLGQVRWIHVEERAERRAPAAVLRPGVVEEGDVRRVRGHGEPARAPVHEVFLDVEPAEDPREDFRLVLPDPVVFPDRILDARGDSARDDERGQELSRVHARDAQAALDAATLLLRGALVHVRHGRADGPAFPVDENQTLHLAAEGDGPDRRSVEAGGC